jgi:signal transduction histidine kinase
MSLIFILSYILFQNLSKNTFLKTESEFHANIFTPVAYNQDGCDEFLIQKDFRYYLTDKKGICKFQLNFPEENISFLGCMDFDGKPPQELIFQSKVRDSIGLYIYSESQLIRKVFIIAGHDVNKPAGFDGSITSVTPYDINNDGTNDLVISMATNFDLQPRGIMAYDLKNQRELWHFWMGGFPRVPKIIDINQDKKLEIIVSTTATNNGSTANGFSDTLSYVLALDMQGHPVWSRNIGSAFSDLVLWTGDINQDGEVEFVVTECEGSGNKQDPNQIVILNGQNGTTIKYIRTGDKFMGMVVTDINRDDNYEIITGNTDGKVRMFSSDLNLIRERDFGSRVDLLAVGDLNDDGMNEVIVVQPNDHLIFLNENLATLGDYISSQGEKISVDFIHDGHRKKILLASGEKAPYLYSILTMPGPTLGKILTKTSGVHLLVFALLLLIIIVLFWLLMVIRKKLSQKDDYTSQVSEWSTFAQQLAHEIKNPLSTINLTLQRLQEISKKHFGDDSDVVDNYTRSVLEEVDRLRNTTDKFMKVLAIEKLNIQPENVNILIDQALIKYESAFSKGIKVKKLFASDLPLVDCDARQILSALFNVLENAQEAMEGQGILTIQTMNFDKMINKNIIPHIVIKIEDTGKGIPVQKMENLFKPFITTKKSGTGLGLTISKKIIESHGGNIKIQSRENIGTVVTIEMPVSFNKMKSNKANNHG